MKNLPKTAVFFILTLIISMVVRCLQYSAVIKPENGFFDTGGGFLNTAYYVLFLLSIIGLFVFAVWDRKTKTGIRKRNSLRVSSGAAAAGGVFTAVLGFLFTYEAVKAVINKSGFMEILLFLSAAGGYTLIGYVIFTRKRFLPVTGIGFIMLAVHYTFSAAGEFMSRIYIASLSSRLIILSVNLLLAAFFMFAGRIPVHSRTRSTAVMVTVLGYSAALLIFSDGFARFIYIMTADKETKDFVYAAANGFNLPQPYYLIQGAAVLWLIFALSSAPRIKSEPDAEAGSTRSQETVSLQDESTSQETVSSQESSPQDETDTGEI
jgi:hypothetical protein